MAFAARLAPLTEELVQALTQLSPQVGASDAAIPDHNASCLC